MNRVVLNPLLKLRHPRQIKVRRAILALAEDLQSDKYEDVDDDVGSIWKLGLALREMLYWGKYGAAVTSYQIDALRIAYEIIERVTEAEEKAA